MAKVNPPILEVIDAFLISPCDIPNWRDKTWREWFADALSTLCVEGEGFSGKRPNCDSGWESDLATGLARIEPKAVPSWEPLEEGCHPCPKRVDWGVVSALIPFVVNRLCGISIANSDGSALSSEDDEPEDL